MATPPLKILSFETPCPWRKVGADVTEEDAPGNLFASHQEEEEEEVHGAQVGKGVVNQSLPQFTSGSITKWLSYPSISICDVLGGGGGAEEGGG